jgi:hypothetical protein
MRLIPSAAAAAALIAATSACQAQSAYDYPWCAFYERGVGATSCYYTTREQCMETLSGIGGTCIPGPYHHGPPPARRRKTPDRD